MIDKELMKKRICGIIDVDTKLSEISEMVKAVDSINPWHPYPQEKPTEGTYLVTCKDFDGDTDLCFGDFKYGIWLHCPYHDDQVIAWAELPKAYEG